MREKPIKVKLSNGANVVVKGANGQDDSFENHREVESALLNDDGDLEATYSPNLESHKLFETPRSSRRLSSIIQKTKSKLSTNEKKQILLNYLFANGENLGITQKGEVLRSMRGVPIQKSSLEAIVERLLDDGGPGSSSPPGTQILRGRLAKDSKYNQLIIKLKEEEADQFGKGKRARKERDERRNLGSGITVGAQHKFRPSKW